MRANELSWILEVNESESIIPYPIRIRWAVFKRTDTYTNMLSGCKALCIYLLVILILTSVVYINYLWLPYIDYKDHNNIWINIVRSIFILGMEFLAIIVVIIVLGFLSFMIMDCLKFIYTIETNARIATAKTQMV